MWVCTKHLAGCYDGADYKWVVILLEQNLCSSTLGVLKCTYRYSSYCPDEERATINP